MYVYKITNNINGKAYIGITNNPKRRWENEKSYPSDPKKRQVIQNAIHKYGAENFNFEILYKGISIEQAVDLEEKLIEEENTLIPNGYNVARGGSYHPCFTPKYGADNGNAHLREEEAQYILDHRDIPACLLYEDFQDKITYPAFMKIYHHETYKNLKTNTSEYPYNREFSCQFSTGPLEYDDVVKIRNRYNNKEYWKDVYNDYKELYPDPWTFWNIYYGNRYKLVMPEVFTEQNRKAHSKMGRSGARNGRAKLTEEDVRTIRKLWKEGITRQELYQKYPQVNPVSIRDIINNKTWRNLL